MYHILGDMKYVLTTRRNIDILRAEILKLDGNPTGFQTKRGEAGPCHTQLAAVLLSTAILLTLSSVVFAQITGPCDDCSQVLSRTWIELAGGREGASARISLDPNEPATVGGSEVVELVIPGLYIEEVRAADGNIVSVQV